LAFCIFCKYTLSHITIFLNPSATYNILMSYTCILTSSSTIAGPSYDAPKTVSVGAKPPIASPRPNKMTLYCQSKFQQTQPEFPTNCPTGKSAPAETTPEEKQQVWQLLQLGILKLRSCENSAEEEILYPYSRKEVIAALENQALARGMFDPAQLEWEIQVAFRSIGIWETTAEFATRGGFVLPGCPCTWGRGSWGTGPWGTGSW